jgi:triosephosphate isomerase
MRNLLVVGVWKDRLTYKESIQAATRVANEFKGLRLPFAAAIAPTPIALVAVKELIEPVGLLACAQNVMWAETTGSYIGETTLAMLRELDCKYVIVGHSERRIVFRETNEIVGRKARDCISSHIRPIVCIGDSADDRANSKTWDVIEAQLRALFDGAVVASPSEILIAYEPVWAISTWRTAEPLPSGALIDDLHRRIRNLISTLVGQAFADAISILYGGSVNSTNGREYLKEPNIDGALVGGASKEPKSLIETFRACQQGVDSRI